VRQIDFAHPAAPDQAIDGEAADDLPFGERTIARGAAGQVDRGRRHVKDAVGARAAASSAGMADDRRRLG
jgi:hypothetical protein